MVRVKLPKTEPAEDPHVTILRVNADGQPSLDDRPVPLESLEAELKAIKERDAEIAVQLRSDRAAVFDAVAKVMASAQRSGIGKLSFVTLPQ